MQSSEYYWLCFYTIGYAIILMLCWRSYQNLSMLD